MKIKNFGVRSVWYLQICLSILDHNFLTQRLLVLIWFLYYLKFKSYQWLLPKNNSKVLKINTEDAKLNIHYVNNNMTWDSFT